MLCNFYVKNEFFIFLYIDSLLVRTFCLSSFFINVLIQVNSYKRFFTLRKNSCKDIRMPLEKSGFAPSVGQSPSQGTGRNAKPVFPKGGNALNLRFTQKTSSGQNPLNMLEKCLPKRL